MSHRHPGPFRHQAHAHDSTPHRAGHYSPDVRELEPPIAPEPAEDWSEHFARLGAEAGLHSLHLD